MRKLRPSDVGNLKPDCTWFDVLYSQLPFLQLSSGFLLFINKLVLCPVCKAFQFNLTAMFDP